ncbi:coil containing protein [Vibrio phage 1.081.O._10N.286.52.C2]|nr:coil containing protein [Vibrio phage 1.081.O._10N.286.52.C2]
MQIKEQLLEAVSQDDTKITTALDGIFESVELSEDVRTKFSTVFESVIKTKAVELAEAHIAEAATKAEAIITEHKEELNEAAEKYGEHLAEQMSNKLDSYLDHVVDAWMAENKLAVENGLKVSMFDGLMEGMKNVFIENNVNCPDEQIDMIDTLEENITDLEARLDVMVVENRGHKEFANKVEKKSIVERVTKGMAESQKEQVSDLAESIRFDENFEDNLNSVIKFAAGIKLAEMEDEKGDEEKKKPEPKKDGEDDAEKKDEEMEESTVPSMGAYLRATRSTR